MRPSNSANPRAGLVLIVALFIITGLVSLAGAGLMRSVNEVSIAQRYAADDQAFYLAEGGVDTKLTQLRDTDPLNDAAGVSLNLGSSLTITLSMTDLGGGLWRAQSSGIVTDLATHTITVTMQAAAPPPLGAFNYAAAGTSINLNGAVTIGDISLTDANRPTLYVDATTMNFRQGDVLTARSANIWIKAMNFFNPNNYTLGTICGSCTDQSIWHPLSNNKPVDFGTGEAVPTANGIPHATQLPPLQFALQPYYDEALREQAADGQAYHHITTTTSLPSGTYTGVIYVECGVTLTLSGATIVMNNAVIVHEGCDGALSLERGASLTMTSDNNAFAKGLAIIGNPTFHWRNSTINIQGFVMAGGSPSVQSWFGADGTVSGGVLAVQSVSGCPGCVGGVNGPGTSNALTWGLGGIHLPGSVQIMFQPLPGTPPGFSSTSGSAAPANSQPTILAWQAQ